MPGTGPTPSGSTDRPPGKGRSPRLPREAAYWITLAIVALAPLPFGSVYQWSWAGIAFGVGLAALLVSITAVLGGHPLIVPSRPVGAACGLYLAVTAWAWAQSVRGMPPPLAHPAWTLLTTAGLDARGAISIAPDATLAAVLRLLAYGALFWMGYQFAGRSTRIRTALKVLVAAGSAYAAFGLLAQFLAPGELPWIRRPPYGTDITGTFVNRNTFATYAGFALLCGTALIARELTLPGTGPLGLAAWRRMLSGHGHAVAAGAAAGTILLASLLLSGSRGGIGGTLAGMAVFLAALAWSRPHRRGATRNLAVALVACSAVVFLVAGGRIVERMDVSRLGLGGRLDVYETALRAISERPLTGTGAGTFADAFLLFQNQDIGTFAYAHSLYLGTAVELGLPALAALTAAALLVAAALLLSLRDRRLNPVYPALGLALLTMVASHGLLDFTLSIPAVAATFALLLGFSAGAADAHVARGSAPAGVRTQRPDPPTPRRRRGRY